MRGAGGCAPCRWKAFPLFCWGFHPPFFTYVWAGKRVRDWLLPGQTETRFLRGMPSGYSFERFVLKSTDKQPPAFQGHHCTVQTAAPMSYVGPPLAKYQNCSGGRGCKILDRVPHYPTTRPTPIYHKVLNVIYSPSRLHYICRLTDRLEANCIFI